MRRLTEEDIFVGLLDYGLFSEKVPPCFTSAGLAGFVRQDSNLKRILNQTDEKKLRKALGGRAHDFIRYEAIRDINIPRPLGIPHPESYAIQVLSIKRFWAEIKKHCAQPKLKISRIHVRHVGGGRVFEMNYKGDERFQLEEDELKWMAGAAFVVKTDISKCFHSIYTHTIPWALNGRAVAKQTNDLLRLSGNFLDKCTQNLRDRQTNGLLIGPHSSNVISEVILTSVDRVMKKKGYKKLKRHIDDYEFYAGSYEEAEEFLHDLGLALREFELSLNDKKTHILPLPRPSAENWIRELNIFPFPKEEEIKFSTVRSFLDLALELSKQFGSSVPLNYAIKMMPDRLNERARRLYIQEAVNLSLVYPYLASLLDENVFEKYPCSGAHEVIVEFCNQLLKLGLKKLYPDAIAYSLFYALKYSVDLPLISKSFKSVLELEDCLTTVLLLEYAHKFKCGLAQKAIHKYADDLKSADSREQDRQWLLIYQTWSEADLRNNTQQFLADLKKTRFSFLSNNYTSNTSSGASMNYGGTP